MHGGTRRPRTSEGSPATVVPLPRISAGVLSFQAQMSNGAWSCKTRFARWPSAQLTPSEPTGPSWRRSRRSPSGRVTGPYFGYSDTWQLFINTGTTIVTFLMVFLIQNTQNRESPRS